MEILGSLSLIHEIIGQSMFYFSIVNFARRINRLLESFTFSSYVE